MTPARNSVLSVSGLKVKFNGHLVLGDVSFIVPRDTTLAILGPNGAGKTVLFKAILNLIPYEGKVNWASHLKIGYVPQKIYVPQDFPLTVAEFLQFKEKNHSKIHEALARVGIKNTPSSHLHTDTRVLKTRLGALSGGELQRIMIVFALLGEPQVLLFDEPTSGVDLSGEETIYGLINKLKKEKDLTIIFVSHELEVVYKYADSVLCLNKQKICFGPPRQAIDQANLTKLYGEKVNFYEHHES